MRGAKFTVPLVLFRLGYGGFVGVGLFRADVGESSIYTV
jgi:hypothetical protein